MQEGSVCMLLCFRKYFQVSHFSVGGSRLFVLCRWLNLSSSKWCFASLTSTLLRLSQLLRGLDNRDGLLTLTVSIGALENSVSNTVVFLSVESYTSCWEFLCNIQLPVILTISMRKSFHLTSIGISNILYDKFCISAW